MCPVVLNPSFETEGASPWLAANWTVTIVSTGWLPATFTTTVGLRASVEEFRLGWGPDELAEVANGFHASIDETWVGKYLQVPNQLEEFDHWRQFVLGTAINSEGDVQFFESLTVEDFIAGWPNEDDEFTFTGDEVLETFDNWLPFDYAIELDPMEYAPIGVAGGFSTIEDLLHIFPDKQFFVDFELNVLVCTNHLLGQDQTVQVLTTGVRPDGLAQGIVYYAQPIDDNTLTLSKTPSGAAVNITSPGAGTHTLRVDQKQYWTDVVEV
jgi:hypothetical protein